MKERVYTDEEMDRVRDNIITKTSAVGKDMARADEQLLSSLRENKKYLQYMRFRNGDISQQEYQQALEDIDREFSSRLRPEGSNYPLYNSPATPEVDDPIMSLAKQWLRESIERVTARVQEEKKQKEELLKKIDALLALDGTDVKLFPKTIHIDLSDACKSALAELKDSIKGLPLPLSDTELANKYNVILNGVYGYISTGRSSEQACIDQINTGIELSYLNGYVKPEKGFEKQPQ